MRDHLREKVTAAFPIHPRGHEVDFWTCLLALRDYDREFIPEVGGGGGKRLVRGPRWLIAMQNSGNVAIGRNHICKRFLEETETDWLWFIDTDQTFDPDILERMIASADPVERPILSALIMAERDRENPISPACIGFTDDDPPQPCTYDGIPPVQHWPVGATGSGCVLIHRSVLQAMWEQYKDHPFPFFEYARWNRTMPDGSIVPGVLGEDYTFALRANALGFTCWVDTTIEAGHIKPRTLTSADYWQSHPKQHAERMQAIPAATVTVIPFKDKWSMTRNLCEQIEHDGDLLLLMNNGSTLEETKRATDWARSRDRVQVLDCKGQGIHEMWNTAVDICLQSFPKFNLAVLNNDLDAGPDMLPALAAGLRYGDERLIAVCPNYDGRSDEDEGDYPDEDKDGSPLLGIDRLTGIYAGGNGNGLAGFCFMVKGELFQSGYRFPEECMWWFGDNDLTMTIDALGGWYGMVHAATVKHLDGGSQTLGDADDYGNSPQGIADLKAFAEKWGLTVERAS